MEGKENILKAGKIAKQVTDFIKPQIKKVNFIKELVFSFFRFA